MKYFGVMTPFKGVRLYSRAPMGYHCTSAYLDELLSRIFGDMVQKHQIFRIADDIYVGAEQVEDLFDIWSEWS